MKRPKRLLSALAALAFALALAAVALVAWAVDDLRGLRYRLVEDVQALAQASFARPVQAPPVLPGHFGERAAQPWMALGKLQSQAADLEACRALRDGSQPFAEASPGCLLELSKAGSALQALLRATHAEAAGPLSGTGALDALPQAEEPIVLKTAAYTARMAALRLRAELAAGQTVAAVVTCVDVLALARDLSWGTALVGRLAALTVSEVAVGPCAAALAAATPTAKRRAVLALALVGQGTPGLEDTLAETSVALRAQLFAPYLAESLPQLPPAVQGWADNSNRRLPPSLSETVVLAWRWDRLQTVLGAATEAARLPSPEARVRLGVLSAQAAAISQTFGKPFPDLRSLAIRDERVRAQLLVLRHSTLVEALRAENAVWASLPEPTAADATRAQATYANVTVQSLQSARKTYARTCGACHPPHLPAEFPARRWPQLVDEMVREQGVQLSEEQRQQVEEFLTVMAKTK